MQDLSEIFIFVKSCNLMGFQTGTDYPAYFRSISAPAHLHQIIVLPSKQPPWACESSIYLSQVCGEGVMPNACRTMGLEECRLKPLR